MDQARPTPFRTRPVIIQHQSGKLDTYVLTYLVGPLLPEWWAAFYALGFGLIVFAVGGEALALSRYFVGQPDWFTEFGRWFGGLLALAGLTSFFATHKRWGWLRISGGLATILLYSGYITANLAVATSPWLAVFGFGAHSLLEALVILRILHRLTEW